MGEVLIPLIKCIGGYVVKFIIDETGKFIYQVFVDDDGDGEPDDPENPFALIPYEDQSDNDVTVIDNSPQEVILTDDNRIDTSVGIYGSMCEVVGMPVTRDQENILLVGSVALLILGCAAIFKIVNYLFHI